MATVYTMAAAPGSFGLTGDNSGLTYIRSGSAASGSFTVSGGSATLTVLRNKLTPVSTLDDYAAYTSLLNDYPEEPQSQ